MGICGVVSSALGELRTGNTHPRSKQVPRIDVQKQWSVERRGSGVESWRTAVMGGGEAEDGWGVF